MTIGSEACYIEWWKGPLGDTSASQLMQSNMNHYYTATTGGTYWARVYGIDYDYGNPYDNYTCYTDSATVTVP